MLEREGERERERKCKGGRLQVPNIIFSLMQPSYQVVVSGQQKDMQPERT